VLLLVLVDVCCVVCHKCYGSVWSDSDMVMGQKASAKATSKYVQSTSQHFSNLRLIVLYNVAMQYPLGTNLLDDIETPRATKDSEVSEAGSIEENRLPTSTRHIS